MRARLAGEIPVTAPAPLITPMPLPERAPRRRGWLPPAWRTPAGACPRARGPRRRCCRLALAGWPSAGRCGRPRRRAQYITLSAPAEAGATAVVRFKPDATEAQIRHGLKDSGARLVDGPTVSDAYVVRLPRDRYAAALEKLRKEPGVALVEALESASP